MSYEQDRSKKRRTNKDGDYVDTSKPSAFFKPKGGREWTISIAVPGSMISNCRKDTQRSTIIGHLARSLAVFAIDEVVIFDDSPTNLRTPPGSIDPQSYTGELDPCGYIEHVLLYLEAPPFMRKALMPIHPNLQGAGMLPSLDMPHHPNPIDYLPYCEGMTITGARTGTLVDVGLKDPVQITEKIPPKTRVTLHTPNGTWDDPEPVHPAAPRTDAGYYWGYSIRRSSSLAAVFEESKFEGGYDMSIGTSERGMSVSDAFPGKSQKAQAPEWNHLLIVFGGPKGIEFAAENDPALYEMGITKNKTKELFDHWVNVLPGQGSRTIRTDEALFIGLTSLRRLWESR